MMHEDTTQLPVKAHQQPGLFFYPAWVVVTVLCIPLAFLLTFPVLRILIIFVGERIVVNGVRFNTEDYLFIYPFILLAGLLTGAAQYALLRAYLPHMRAWILATTLGWMLGLSMTLIAGWLNITDGTLDFRSALPLLGLAIGVAQWLVLRRRLPQAGWWIVASLIGWALLAWNPDVIFKGAWWLFIFPACTTAAALWWLLGREKVEG